MRRANYLEAPPQCMPLLNLQDVRAMSRSAAMDSALPSTPLEKFRTPLLQLSTRVACSATQTGLARWIGKHREKAEGNSSCSICNKA